MSNFPNVRLCLATPEICQASNLSSNSRTKHRSMMSQTCFQKYLSTVIWPCSCYSHIIGPVCLHRHLWNFMLWRFSIKACRHIMFSNHYKFNQRKMFINECYWLKCPRLKVSVRLWFELVNRRRSKSSINTFMNIWFKTNKFLDLIISVICLLLYFDDRQ